MTKNNILKENVVQNILGECCIGSEGWTPFMLALMHTYITHAGVVRCRNR